MLSRFHSVGKKLLVAAAAGLLLGPIPASADANLDALYQAAKKEGQLTWYEVPLVADEADRVAARFSELYPGVKVNVVRTTAQVIWQRVNQELAANAVQADVFSTTIISQLRELKQKGELIQYRPHSIDTMVDNPLIKNMDPDGYYFCTVAYLMTIGYNTSKIKANEAPANWPDMANPKWKGQLSVTHPGFSGAGGVWALQMQKLYGNSFFESLEKNSPQIGRSTVDTVTTISSGERSVGMVPAFVALGSKAKGNPIDIVYPTDGSVISLSASAILKRAKNPNAAKLFMEYLHSNELSRSAVREYRESLHPDVTPPPGAKQISDVKTLLPSDDEIEKGLPPLIQVWRDLFGI